MAQVVEEHGKGRLRRELGFLETIALSIGISAPTAVLALNGVLPATLVGRAVPLAFLFSGIAVILVSYVFIRMARQFSHAGSVYAFTGRTWGPRAGFFGGWALLGTYLAFTIASTAEVGLFGQTFLQEVGVLTSLDWIVIALVAAALMWFLVYGDIRVATRTLISLEAVSVAAILVLFVIIYVKIFSGSAPRHQGLSLSPFRVPAGVSWSTVAFAAVAGFLSFGGFEGAAALGEESQNPRRTIPRVILTAVLALSVFYTLGMFTETIGYGTDLAGVHAFAGSSSPLGDLSNAYVGSWMADIILLGAVFSAFASALGTATAGARILFALGRDGFITPRLGDASRRTGSPANAAAVIMTIAIVSVIALRLNGTNAVNAFFYPGTVGVLTILVAYMVTNIAGIRFFFLGRRIPLWQVLVPVLAIAFLFYTLYKNVYPVPAYPYNLFPYIAGTWIVIGALCVVLVPGLARRIGVRLASDDAEDATAGA